MFVCKFPINTDSADPVNTLNSQMTPFCQPPHVTHLDFRVKEIGYPVLTPVHTCKTSCREVAETLLNRLVDIIGIGCQGKLHAPQNSKFRGTVQRYTCVEFPWFDRVNSCKYLNIGLISISPGEPHCLSLRRSRSDPFGVRRWGISSPSAL
jgi:hypothetical protein